jgi:CTP synthase
MRLGADPVKVHAGTAAREIYGEAVIYERHRHRYEVSISLRKRLEHAGLVVSGTSPDERLVEMIELHDHPFFVASQFHPEFKSRPERPAPLFREFIAAALDRAGEADAETEAEADGEDAASPAEAADGQGRVRISDGRTVGLGRSDAA